MQLEIVTPEKIAYSGTCQMAVIPATMGEMGVMDNHENMITALKNGSVKIYTNENVLDNTINITGGFAEIGNNICRILADKVA